MDCSLIGARLLLKLNVLQTDEQAALPAGGVFSRSGSVASGHSYNGAVFTSTTEQ